MSEMTSVFQSALRNLPAAAAWLDATLYRPLHLWTLPVVCNQYVCGLRAKAYIHYQHATVCVLHTIVCVDSCMTTLQSTAPEACITVQGSYQSCLGRCWDGS